jgi:hypothetical protein
MKEAGPVFWFTEQTTAQECSCWGFMDAYLSGFNLSLRNPSPIYSIAIPLLSLDAGGPSASGISPAALEISNG